MRVQIDFQANTELVRFDCILSSEIRWLNTIKMITDASFFASRSRTALPASSKSMQFSWKCKFWHDFVWKHRMDFINFGTWKIGYRFAEFALIILQGKTNAKMDFVGRCLNFVETDRCFSLEFWCFWDRHCISHRTKLHWNFRVEFAFLLAFEFASKFVQVNN